MPLLFFSLPPRKGPPARLVPVVDRRKENDIPFECRIAPRLITAGYVFSACSHGIFCCGPLYMHRSGTLNHSSAQSHEYQAHDPQRGCVPCKRNETDDLLPGIDRSGTCGCRIRLACRAADHRRGGYSFAYHKAPRWLAPFTELSTDRPSKRIVRLMRWSDWLSPPGRTFT